MSLSEQGPLEAQRPPQVVLSAKNGLATSEFWQTLLVNILSIAVAAAALFGKNFNSAPFSALIPGVAALAAAIVTSFYSHSRASEKSAVHAANAQIMASSPSTEN